MYEQLLDLRITIEDMIAEGEPGGRPFEGRPR